MKRFLIILAVFVIPSYVYAGGSVSFSEVKNILNQDSYMAEFVNSSFLCQETGYTDFVIGRMFPLGGKRLGPYKFDCHLKGYTGGYNLRLIINTTNKMYDNEGNEVPLNKATRVKEIFKSLTIEKK